MLPIWSHFVVKYNFKMHFSYHVPMLSCYKFGHILCHLFNPIFPPIHTTKSSQFLSIHPIKSVPLSPYLSQFIAPSFFLRRKYFPVSQSFQNPDIAPAPPPPRDIAIFINSPPRLHTHEPRQANKSHHQQRTTTTTQSESYVLNVPQLLVFLFDFHLLFYPRNPLNRNNSDFAFSFSESVMN